MLLFGRSDIGTTDDQASISVPSVYKTACPTGLLTKFTGYISGLGTGAGASQVSRAILYADTAGLPGAFLKLSDEITVLDNAPYAWVDFPLTTPFPIVAQTCWLGYYAGTSTNLTQLKYFAVGLDEYRSFGTYPTPTDPFGAPTGNFVGEYSLYGTVLEPPPRPKVNFIYLRKNR